MEFLSLYAELCLAWVAFTAIVATLRQALGGHFTPLQYVMFRYFVESSLLFFITTLIALALLESMPVEKEVWRVTTALQAGCILIYLPYHMRRRARLGVPLPLTSLLVSVGYASVLILQVLALLGIWIEPSIKLIAAACVYSIAGNSVVFVQFLGSFVEVRPE